MLPVLYIRLEHYLSRNVGVHLLHTRKTSERVQHSKLEMLSYNLHSLWKFLSAYGIQYFIKCADHTLDPSQYLAQSIC